MLDASTKTQLKTYLDRATQPIEIVASLDDSKASSDMQSLLADIRESSSLVTVQESRADNHRKPSFSINRPSENHGPRFAGLPMGHEFTSLILALLQFKPAPMYILDEVDAALDLSHTQNIGRLIKTRFKGSQFVVVSLKDGMFQNANRVFRTRFSEGTSVVSVMTPGELKG